MLAAYAFQLEYLLDRKYRLVRGGARDGVDCGEIGRRLAAAASRPPPTCLFCALGQTLS
jgi:hypothetical protein